MVYEMAAELVVFQVLKLKSEERELGFGVAARFTDMELEDDEDIETMVAFYCPTGSVNTELMQLFVELADVEFDIDLSALPMSKNLNSGLRLQIHPVLIKTDVDDEDGYDNNGCSGYEVEDYSEPNLDEVPDDINNKYANYDGNVYASLVGNPS
ncbi:hypothetical protein J1N35_000846 [Gossypium stocksii]|uniref:Uncharacterized protein n=1 Tax=Gossypium stocksii TaxID=47602 RepID=A0A9D4AL56_9ROSI|nr:hypothetical protein J1N35_000846 [Gossypium stocksii]